MAIHLADLDDVVTLNHFSVQRSIARLLDLNSDKEVEITVVFTNQERETCQVKK